jgi:hypothetical protein
MKIPPFWAKETFSDTDQKGRKHSFIATGWSFTSLDEAKTNALARARKSFDFIINDQKPGSYEDYLNMPVREEILEEITESSKQIGLITRNRYGSLVLNAAEVAFVDVDFPPLHSSGLMEWIVWIFQPSKKKEKQKALQDNTLQTIEDWAKNNPARGFRLYRTCAGFRLLFTDRLYSPTAPETTKLLEELGSDRLYRTLTFKQECFRARLTPKPWRCNCRRPAIYFPWAGPDHEKKYRDWEQTYKKASSGYRTCDMIKQYGPHTSDRVIQKIIDTHDQRACGMAQQVLA